MLKLLNRTDFLRKIIRLFSPGSSFDPLSEYHLSSPPLHPTFSSLQLKSRNFFHWRQRHLWRLMRPNLAKSAYGHLLTLWCHPCPQPTSNIPRILGPAKVKTVLKQGFWASKLLKLTLEEKIHAVRRARNWCSPAVWAWGCCKGSVGTQIYLWRTRLMESKTKQPLGCDKIFRSPCSQHRQAHIWQFNTSILFTTVGLRFLRLKLQSYKHGTWSDQPQVLLSIIWWFKNLLWCPRDLIKSQFECESWRDGEDFW